VNTQGERGARGDQGQHGQDGRQGEEGVHGVRGVQGEDGIQGLPGAQGEPGEPGQPPGGALRLTDRRLLVLYIFLAAALVLLAFRAETNSRNIAKNQDRLVTFNHERCVDGVAILTQFNGFVDAMAEVEQDNESTTDRIRARRLKAFEEARIDFDPDACERLVPGK